MMHRNSVRRMPIYATERHPTFAAALVMLGVVRKDTYVDVRASHALSFNVRAQQFDGAGDGSWVGWAQIPLQRSW